MIICVPVPKQRNSRMRLTDAAEARSWRTSLIRTTRPRTCGRTASLKEKGLPGHLAIRSSTSIVPVPKQRNSRDDNARIKWRDAGGLEGPAGHRDGGQRSMARATTARTMSTCTSWCGVTSDAAGRQVGRHESGHTASDVWADSAGEILKRRACGIHRATFPERAGEAGRRCGRASSTCSGPRATTWAGRWCAVSGWYGRGRGSG